MEDKKVIDFYRSFFDVSKELNKEQFYDFNMSIYRVMFFEVHIDTIDFKDTLLKIVWQSIKHSIKSSLDGYCSKKKIDYNSLFAPLAKGVNIPLANNDNDNVKDKDNVKDNDNDNVNDNKSGTFLEAERLAIYLLKNIKKANTSFSKTHTKWIADIEKLLRIDGKSMDDIKTVIDWIYSDDGKFWQSNILSGRKLREKFEQLSMKTQTATSRALPKVDKLDLEEFGFTSYESNNGIIVNDESIECI